MCLQLNSNKNYTIVKIDIEVYKVVRKDDYGMRTPYQKRLVYFNNINYSSLTVSGGNVVNGIHSFVYLADAKIECELWQQMANRTRLNAKFEIVKCIIPKSSTYYSGIFEIKDDALNLIKRVESIASNCIKYIEII
jgi:hypothetical protein